MFTDTIKYTDYNGNECTSTLYFNLSKPEMIKLEYSVPGGMEKKLQRILDTISNIANTDSDDAFNVVGEMYDFFEMLIQKSYGKKSDDGKRFIKTQEVLDEFLESEAYSEIFMKFMQDPDYVSKFVIGIMPSDIASQVEIDGKLLEAQNFPKE